MKRRAELRAVAIEALDRYLRSGRDSDWTDAGVAAVYAHRDVIPPAEVRKAVRLSTKGNA